MEVKQMIHISKIVDHVDPIQHEVEKFGVAGGKRAIRDAILDYYKLGASSDVFVVADLGCSSGPNTLSFVSDVIATVTERCRQLGRCPPMFLAFLNDLPGSDFNTLFRSLPPRWSAAGGGDGERCFVAGVPGSFYGRLFPTNSVHLFHSAFAAHFLSQVPPELENGEVANRGWVDAAPRSPADRAREAYRRQFQEDFSTFLRARAEELVIGGRLLISLTGREESDPTTGIESYIAESMAGILSAMASEGLVEEEKMGSLNLPIYFASASEVALEIQREGSFSIKSLEVFSAELPGSLQPIPDADQASSRDGTKGAVFARSLGAILEPVLVARMGREAMEVLLQRFAAALDRYFLAIKPQFPTMLVSLEKIYV